MKLQIITILLTIKLYYEAKMSPKFDKVLSEKLDLITRLLELEDGKD